MLDTLVYRQADIPLEARHLQPDNEACAEHGWFSHHPTRIKCIPQAALGILQAP